MEFCCSYLASVFFSLSLCYEGMVERFDGFWASFILHQWMMGFCMHASVSVLKVKCDSNPHMALLPLLPSSYFEDFICEGSIDSSWRLIQRPEMLHEWVNCGDSVARIEDVSFGESCFVLMVLHFCLSVKLLHNWSDGVTEIVDELLSVCVSLRLHWTRRYTYCIKVQYCKTIKT